MSFCKEYFRTSKYLFKISFIFISLLCISFHPHCFFSSFWIGCSFPLKIPVMNEFFIEILSISLVFRRSKFNPRRQRTLKARVFSTSVPNIAAENMFFFVCLFSSSYSKIDGVLMFWHGNWNHSSNWFAFNSNTKQKCKKKKQIAISFLSIFRLHVRQTEHVDEEMEFHILNQVHTGNQMGILLKFTDLCISCATFENF